MEGNDKKDTEMRVLMIFASSTELWSNTLRKLHLKFQLGRRRREKKDKSKKNRPILFASYCRKHFVVNGFYIRIDINPFLVWLFICTNDEKKEKREKKIYMRGKCVFMQCYRI